MSAKPVPKGATLDPSDVCLFGLADAYQIRVLADGSALFEQHERRPVRLSPERLALLARAVLEAQGWLFSKDGGCAAEFKRYPTVSDPEGLGDDMAQALARAVLEKGGWQFVGEPSGVIAAINLGPGLSRARVEKLENYALGVLASALTCEGGGRVRAAMLSLLVSDPPETPEKAH